jgi:hypothetical protein
MKDLKKELRYFFVTHRRRIFRWTRASLFMILGLGIFISISSVKVDPDQGSAHFTIQKIKSPFDNKIYAVKIPSAMDFAGEAVPLHDQDVRERLDRELLVNSYWHSQTLYIMKEYPQIISLVEPILEKNGVPKDFVYLCIAESGLQVNAQSPAGAMGLWQFIKSTGQAYGLTINGEIDERLSYEKSTEAACRYLIEAKERFGSWTTAAASYNRGMEGMEAAVKRQKTGNYYDLYLVPETARYIYRILALKQILQNPQQYGFFLESEELYPEYKYKTVAVDSTISDLPSFAAQQGTNYKTLRVLNPWIINYSLTNKEGKTYEFKLPI